MMSAASTALRLQGSVSTESATDVARGGSFTVLAVFENASYLMLTHDHEAVVALLRREALQLPNSIRLLGDTGDLRGLLAVGDQGRASTDELGVPQVRVGGVRISLIGHHKPTQVRLQAGWAVDPGDLDDLGAAPSLRHRAHGLAAALHVGDPSPLDELVGWGPGLTPTGDDLACGVLLVMVATERLEPAHAIDLIGQRGLRTTSLSARLLRCAAQGMAVPEVVAMVDALLGPDSRASAAQIAAVHAIGHSSGRDLCAGVAGALDHLTGHPDPSARPIHTLATPPARLTHTTHPPHRQ